MTVIAPVVDTGQAWGGARRRDRRDHTAGHHVPDAGSPAGGVGPRAATLAYADPHPAPRPQPFTAGAPLGPAFDGVSAAGVGRRLGALALDTVTVALVAGPVLWFTGSPVYAGLAVAELAVGLVVWEARSGRTVGNAVLGLRTAKQETPYAPGLARAVGRGLLLGAGHLVAGLGQWLIVGSAGLDRTGRGQAWHDKAAGTVVVDVRAMRVEAETVPLAATPLSAPGGIAGPGVIGPAALEPAPAAERSQAFVPTAPVASAVVALTPVVPVESAAPAPPSVPVTPAAPFPAAFLLTLDTGETTTVRGPGVAGRKPQVPAGETCDHVIAIDDPGRSLSRTHIRFGIHRGVFWVEDVGSANGTLLVASDGTTLQVESGERHPVPVGGVVRLGERTLTVRPAP